MRFVCVIDYYCLNSNYKNQILSDDASFEWSYGGYYLGLFSTFSYYFYSLFDCVDSTTFSLVIYVSCPS